MTLTARFPIGTQYLMRGKRSDLCTVVDIYKTYNSKEELVRIRYVSVHNFLGQDIVDNDVVDTTIARNLLPEYQYLLK